MWKNFSLSAKEDVDVEIHAQVMTGMVNRGQT